MNKNVERYRTRLLGRRFGKLIVTEFGGVVKGNKTIWICKCDCGGKKTVRNDSLIKKHTQSCGCLQYKKFKESKSWKGIGDISGSFWTHMKFGAKVRNLEFTITPEYAWNLYLKQDKKCALTGYPISFGLTKLDVNRTASLDRIDSSKGYIEGNIQWVTKKINFMKQALDEKEFIQLCNAVVMFNTQHVSLPN